MKTNWIESARQKLWSAQQCLEIALHEGYPANKTEEFKKLREMATALLNHHETLKPIAKENPRYLWDNLEDKTGKV